MRFFLPLLASSLLLRPALAQSQPQQITPLQPAPEAHSLVQQLLREGKIMRPGEAKRGMKGYGLSVFQGTKVEKFGIEVLGTLERVNGGGDLVMIRVTDGPVVTRQSGIIQGMSGSPVYINGKLLGAIAIGFGFPKEPIGGITPITQMIEGALPDNSPRKAPVKVARNFSAPPQSLEGAYVPKTPLRIGARNVTRVAVSSDLGVPDWSGPDVAASMAMRPCTRLILLSGVSPASLPRWKTLFEPYGLTPMIGGGAMSKAAQAQVFGTPSQKTGVQANLAPGAAIGVQLASGDVDATGVGTVTYRLGNRVLAFGHPMFNLGGVSMPMTTAYVHDIFPAYDISFKLASPIKVVGELQQDTNFAIGGTVGRVAQTVPMHISLRDPAKKINRDWNMKLIQDPLFTPQLATNIAVEALQSTLGLDSAKTVNVSLRMRLKNGPLIERRNTLYAEGLVIQDALGEFLNTLSLTQQNPFEKGEISGVDLKVEVVPGRKTARIRQIFADRNRVKAGERVTISVVLEPTGEPDKSFTKRFVLNVPADAPSGILRVAVSPSNAFWQARGAVGGAPPRPGNLPELLAAYERVGASDVLELQASTSNRFLLIDRKKVSDPPPLWNRLVPQTASTSLGSFNETIDQKQASDYVLSGFQALAIPIESVRPSDRKNPDGEAGDNADAQAQAAQAEEMNAASEVAPLSIDGGADSGLTGDEGEMSADWADFAAPARVKSVLGALNLQIPSKGNEPPKLPDANPKPTPIPVPLPGATPAATPTPAPSPTPDPAADGIARPPGRWIQNTAADFSGGNFSSTVVRDDGAVVPGPRERNVFSSSEPVAWSVAVAPDNTLYVGTGYDARLLQIKNGVSRVLYQGPEVAITALALAPDGTLYAGASPGGRVYRFRPDGTRDTLLQTRETFVHALKWTPQGLYVATGGPRAALYLVGDPAKVSANPLVKPLAILPQTHLRSLDVINNDVYAGTGDDAVLYRVDEKGATALYQATNPANSAILSGTGQSQVLVINAGVGQATQQPQIGQMIGGIARSGLTANNEITAIAAGDGGDIFFGTLTSGTVYRWNAARGVEEYWKSKGQSIYTLLRDGDALYAGCDGGEVWRLSGAGDNVRAARVLDASQPQILALAKQGQSLFAATANNAAVYQIGADAEGAPSQYDSDIFDAKALVNWGTLRSLGEGVAIQTRSGNTIDPDATWSAFSPLQDGRIVSPPGRYLQYRATFAPNGNLTRTEALYRAPNRAPVVKWTLPLGGEALSGKKTLTWNASDPDKDPLRATVSVINSAQEATVVEDATPTDNKVEIDTKKFKDGTYIARVAVSDAARNANDRKSDVAVSLPFVIDNTAPILGELNIVRESAEMGGGWTLGGILSDETSPLAGAEWRIKPDDDEKPKALDKKDAAKTDKSDKSKADDADKTDDGKADAAADKANVKAAATARSTWQALTTADGLFDSKTELLVGLIDPGFAPAPLQSGLKIEVRLRDAAGNSTTKTIVLP